MGTGEGERGTVLGKNWVDRRHRPTFAPQPRILERGYKLHVTIVIHPHIHSIHSDPPRDG
jgi:hypothetical protein